MICGKLYNRVSLFVMVILLLLLIASCNPYKQLSKRPPLTTKDSAALLSRCIKIVPIDTSGHFTVITVPDSSEYWKAQVKTITQIITDTLTDVLTKYKDTCTSAIKTYQQGLKQGYDKGFAKGNEDAAIKYSKAFISADSLFNINLAHLKQSYNFQLLSAQTNERVAVANANKYRGKMDFWKTWAIISSLLAALFLILCILFWKFKRQAKTANTVINDVRSLTK